MKEMRRIKAKKKWERLCVGINEGEAVLAKPDQSLMSYATRLYASQGLDVVRTNELIREEPRTE
jgi:hypothetical protein